MCLVLISVTAVVSGVFNSSNHVRSSSLGAGKGYSSHSSFILSTKPVTNQEICSVHGDKTNSVSLSANSTLNLLYKISSLLSWKAW